jgi:hypothetical protein
LTLVGLKLGPSFQYQCGHAGLADLADARVALGLLGDAIGLAEVVLTWPSTAASSSSLTGRRLPVPARLAGFGGQLVDRLDDDLHFLVGVEHRAPASGLP